MRPTAVEALRGVQGALMSVIAPELRSMFAQDAAQVLQMLLESVANEWDSAAENLSTDNRRLRELLAQALAAIEALSHRDPRLASLAEEIKGGLGDPDASLVISHLSTRNDQLRALLERVIVACEEAVGYPELESLMPVRQEIYHHLREVAARGWSFWDVFSFRDRMARLRAGSA